MGCWDLPEKTTVAPENTAAGEADAVGAVLTN